MERALVENKLFSPMPVFTTDRLIIRAITPRDAADMYEYSCDSDVTKYLTWEPHPSPSFTKRHIKRIERSYNAHTYFDFALELRSSGKMIGTCGFTSFLYEENGCEIGYVINPRYRGYALAVEAAERFIQFAFDELRAAFVFARCMCENDASRRVMEKCGMIYYRNVDRAVVKQNRYRSVSEFRLTKERYILRQQGRDDI